LKVNDFHVLVINSNFGRISHCFQDMASFQLKNAHFFSPFHLMLNLKNVLLGIDG